MHCLGGVIYGPLFSRCCNIPLHSEERFKNIQKLGKYYLSFKNKIHEQMYISTLSPYRWAKNVQLSWQQNVQYQRRRKNRKKKDRLASCYTTAAAAESEFYCPETSIRNPPDHVSHHQQRLHPVTSLQFACGAARPGTHQHFHV